MGTPLAEAFVRVRADVSPFKPDIERGLKGIGDQFGRDFSREATDRVRDERGRFAEAGRELGAEVGDAAGDELGRHLAERGAVQFGDDGNQFVRVGEQVGDDSGKAAGEAFGNRFTKDANGRWHDERGRFVSESEAIGEEAGKAFGKGFDRGGDGKDRGQKVARDFGDGFSAGLSGIGDVGRRVFDLLTPSLGRLAVGFASVTSAAGGLLATVTKWSAVGAAIAALGAAAASASGWVVALAADLVPVGGLVAALPGLLLSGVAALVTWKIALAGVGDAMKAAFSGDPEKLKEALVGLSSEAQFFVGEFSKLVPLMKLMQVGIQDSFLFQLEGMLPRLSNLLLGADMAVEALAASLGGVVREVLDFATSWSTIEQFNTIIDGTTKLVDGLAEAIRPLLTGFVDLGAVGSTWLASMSGGLTSVLTRFGEWMSQVAASGQAWAWMDNALTVLKQLGTLAKNLWGIFAGLFAAAREAGGGALGVLGQLVSLFNTWVNSTEGFDVLVVLFKALNDVGKALLPIITALGGAIADIAPEAAKVAVALGPVLAHAINALGPAVAALGPGIIALIKGLGAAVNAIAPALVPLGSAIGAAFGALRPVLAALGQGIAALLPGVEALLRAFALGLAGIAPALAPLGAALGGILTALSPLFPVLGRLIGLIGVELAAGLRAATPSLALLVAGFGSALRLMAPIIPVVLQVAAAILNGLLPAVGNLVPQFAQLAGPAIAAFGNALLSILPSAVLLIKNIGDLAIAVAPIVPLLLQVAASIINALVPALAPLLPQIGALVTQLVQGLVPALLPLIPLIGQIVGVIGQTLVTVLGVLVQAVVQLLPPISQAAQILGQALLQALQQVGPLLPPLIAAFLSCLPAVANLLPPLANLAVSLLPRFLDAVTQILPLLPDLVRNGILLAQAYYPLIPIFLDLLTRLAPHIPLFLEIAAVIATKLLPPIIKLAETVVYMVDTVNRAFQNMYDRLVGHSIIPDLINGIDQWFGRLPGILFGWVGQAKDAAIQQFQNLINWVSGLPNAIVGALGNVGGLLYNSGRAILQGLIDGLWSMFNSVWNTAVDILNRIRSLFPFSPAKDGPFSGSGWTLYSGMSIGGALADGMQRQRGTVAAAADGLLGSAAAVFGRSLAVPALAGPSAGVGFASGLSTPVLPGRVVEPASGGITVENLNVTVQAILDPRDRSGMRRFAQQLREEIRGLEREAYAT